MAPSSDRGIVDLASSHNVDETVEALEALLRVKGVTLFALIDHSGEAAKIGMRMPPTKLLIFGSPKAGTPLCWRLPASPSTSPSRSWFGRTPGGRPGSPTTHRRT